LSGKRRNIWVVVLAGGDGRRLSALTRNANGICTPKQYCSLNGDHSLLQLALRRALAVTAREHIVPVVTDAHRRWWQSQLLTFRRGGVVVQPGNRGTGLGVLLPLLVIAKCDPEAGVIFFPSDHYVEHEDLLAESLRQATAPEALDSDKITLLGITPNAPDSGFGYLFPAPDSGVGMRPVHQFIEKPDEATAAELFRAGCVWSSGIFAGRIAQIVSLFERHIPGLMLDLTAVVKNWSDPRIPTAELTFLFNRYPAIDYSRDVLQKCPHDLQFLTVPPCGWNDVGTPARLAHALWSVRPVNSHPTAFAKQVFNLATAFEGANLLTMPPCASSTIVNQPLSVEHKTPLPRSREPVDLLTTME
jgi:mannose-1-phosphate guanylyltransferase